jgi:hypothetical protein
MKTINKFPKNGAPAISNKIPRPTAIQKPFFLKMADLGYLLSVSG